MTEETEPLPLAGVRVLELGHVVLGPTCGMILADMGAHVVKVEKAPGGDETRRFGGFGAGLFHFFNRNKTSLAIDLGADDGKAVLRRALASSDVFIENFAPGAVERLGFGYAACAAVNPRLVYCALKGFMPGPYQMRPSLDHLVQMMGGLAYMTGPEGRPLRAGASVTDILGATFGAVGIVTALLQRQRTGRGCEVTAALFESTAFLVGQHMATAAVTGRAPPPMPEGEDPWAVYDLFDTLGGEPVFIGIINDRHWRDFCAGLGLDDLGADADLATSQGRHANREPMMEDLRQALMARPRAEIVAACEDAGIPFAPVARPDELFDDPQLLAGGGLVETALADGTVTRLPRLPLRMGGHNFGLRREPPAIGEGSRAYLASLGYTDDDIDALAGRGVIAVEGAEGPNR